MAVIFSAVGLVIFTTLLSSSYALDNRQNPRESRLQGYKSGANITCGSLEDLANSVNVCAKPLMDIIQGTIEKWPVNDSDVNELCKSFVGSEKCIRDVTRKCAKGLHKTILSTLANSVKRVRNRECAKAKFPALLKTTQCMEGNQDRVRRLISNATSHLDLIEKQMPDLDQKTNSVCCMVADIESAIRLSLGPICKPESEVVVRIYRSVLEDVIELVCRRPKCSPTMYRDYKLNPNVATDGIIPLLLRIIFSLG